MMRNKRIRKQLELAAGSLAKLIHKNGLVWEFPVPIYKDERDFVLPRNVESPKKQEGN